MESFSWLAKWGFAGGLENDFGFAGEAYGRGNATVITNTGLSVLRRIAAGP